MFQGKLLKHMGTYLKNFHGWGQEFKHFQFPPLFNWVHKSMGEGNKMMGLGLLWVCIQLYLPLSSICWFCVMLPASKCFRFGTFGCFLFRKTELSLISLLSKPSHCCSLETGPCWHFLIPLHTPFRFLPVAVNWTSILLPIRFFLCDNFVVCFSF